ncbi:hypothetical protein BCR42DRAFT_13681 [Absidia repens]|uniref:Uncharacterized protein n=1 Tax=Absidia repens TaxID=90262 RepID=A0A1X2J1N7_9FUNG|nr:hypothetical protein BCR42DRAFT_13681 [Absidia repens]
MNLMLRSMLQANIKICTRLEYGQGGTQLTITILNATVFPVTLSTGTLDFIPVNSHPTFSLDHVDSQVKLVSASHHMTNDEQASHQQQQRVDSLFVPPPSVCNADNINTNTPLLHPNTKHIEIVNIRTTQPIQLNGTIRIQVSRLDDSDPTPVQLTHSFGFYLIDQMKKSILSTSTDYKENMDDNEGYEWCYGGQFIRDTFSIDPVLGLEKGMLICLEPASSLYSDGAILCRIDSERLDDGSIQVRFFGKNKNLVRSLVHELDSLDV